MPKRSTNQWFRVVHKWAGLLAAFWILVLGSTGVILDHPDWRWTNQATVPESWGSPDLTRFIRVTYMRQILVDPDDTRRWIGGSERGLWFSSDGGASWKPVDFEGIDFSPQTYALVAHPVAGFEQTLVGTDEGIWRFTSETAVERFALDDQRVTSLTAGPGEADVLGVTNKTRVFRLDTGSGATAWSEMRPIEPVIAGGITFNRYLLNIHFGHGMAEGATGVLINDFGGLAMVILALSGTGYWFVRRRWRRDPALASSERKRSVTSWLYRSHAPIIGILAVVPIFYVSVTGIFGDHIRAIYDWAESITVPAYLVPAGFSMRSLDDDVQDIVVNPQHPAEWIIATRKGLYRSADTGKHWQLDASMPIEKADYGNSLNLFRVDNALFLGAGLNASFSSLDGGRTWMPVSGPFTGISSGAFSQGTWHLKNSQGVFSGQLGEELQPAAVVPPPLTGMPLFLYLADIHTGHAIAPWFPWVNDVVALLAIILVCSGPVIWWRRKWM